MAQKILVLDDEENYAEMLKALLEQHHFIVDTVTKAEDALEALQQYGHELIISDFKMPVMDGATFLQRAREIDPDLPFILVSGLMNTPELVKVANMGVTLVLEKPIDVNVFIESVQRFVSPLTEEEYAKYYEKTVHAEGEGAELEEALPELTYPQELQFLGTGGSIAAQKFLQALWEGHESGGDMVVAFPSGAEIELALREISHWKKQSSGFIHLLSAAQIGTAEFNELLASNNQNTRASNVVGITGLHAIDEAQQNKLIEFINDPAAMCPDAANNVFIYFVEQSLLEYQGSDYSTDLLDLYSENAIVMPALKERMMDIGIYFNRYLSLIAEKENLDGKITLSDSAMSLFLSYPWPGNFRELISVIRYMVNLGTSGEVSAELVSSILSRNENSGIPDALAEASLKGVLLAAQGRMLHELLAEDGMGLPALLESIKVEDVAASEVVSPDELEFLFNEMLSAKTE